MSRRSAVSMHASGSLDPVLPLRGYFLAAGGALLLLLLAVDWVLPAPLPERFDASNPALPPIRIHSDVKGPEAVSIDTQHPLPAHTDEVVMAASQPGNPDAPDAVEETGSAAQPNAEARRPAASLAPQVRNSLAQAIPDQVAGMAHATPKRGQKSRRVRTAKLRRPAQSSKRGGTPGWCNEANGRCSDALVFFRPF
ncbi:hypothetical protein [Bradyrhizobium sp. SZCCHNPS1003]|uniref:hypothetical protein n=1 Tax=Bradyrhizobium sp. SZCCHNPS1003 TaxID=3057330 RepID=UPI0028E1DFC5|nr:hypothetical protein [Bradyrhizobium sp. SZCCHNPS1003]